ncbi:MAG: peptide ABC transporter substrate-binding protein [Thermomicrobiales bacterium]
MARSASLGIGVPLALLALNSVRSAASVAAEDAAFGRPSLGTEGQVRGAGGELRIRQWLTPAGLNPHTATAEPDLHGASLVTEGLLSYARDGSLLPTLVSEVPSLENGGLSEDLRIVNYTLLPNLVWNDGQPVTADDVVWTWQWIMDEMNAAVDASLYAGIERVEVKTPAQAQVVFSSSTLAWFVPFNGSEFGGGILPRHFWAGRQRESANQAFLTNPVGTGPYKVDAFIPGDRVIYAFNEHYREPNKPYFSTVVLQGGGDHLTAAQAVLQTGDADVAWNLSADPDVLQELEAFGLGTVQANTPIATEKIWFNFSDPNFEIDGERSSLKAPHPILTDPAVRQAMALAIDRRAIASRLYLGEPLEPPATNVLVGISAMESPRTTWEYDIDRANQLLDDAGWKWDGDVRTRNSVELRVSLYTTIIPTRQKTQAMIKQYWEAIGIRVELVAVDTAEFFDRPDNPQSYIRFQHDVQMFTNSPLFPFPLDYMKIWYAGPGAGNVAQRANNWVPVNDVRFQNFNVQRFVNPAYDALWEAAATTTDMGRAVELLIQMNDVVVNECVVIPLVERATHKYAIGNRLVEENVAVGPWETLYWNIANWRTVQT